MEAKNKMKNNTWKVLAIIFITLFILESIFLGWALLVGTNMIENESECSINVCGRLETTMSFIYDEYNKMCYCYDNTGEVIHQQYIK